MQQRSFQRRSSGKGGFGGRSTSSGAPRRNGGSAFSGMRSFSRRPRVARKVKQLDPALFVKAAIKTEESKPFEPTALFAEMTFHDLIKKNMASRGFTHPTPIQDGAIPKVLEGRDVIGKAATGTGKTVAFLVPMIDKVLRKRSERVFIMAPTRELALQIDEEFKIFSRGSGLRSVLVIGGANMSMQIRNLSYKPNFVIATPGRAKDLVEQKALDLSSFGNVVLDEVDRMLDMGFIKDIKFLLGLLRKERQSLFFSATLEKETRVIAKTFLNNPVTVVIESRRTSESVEQDVVYFATPEEKIETLHEILSQKEVEKVLIFMRMKFATTRLAEELNRRGFKADAIHGNLRQSKRQRVLQLFRSDRIHILIATDVAARGLDIDGVTHVINYDAPESYEDYIHRIGRTGRANKTGKAITFVEAPRR